MKSSESVRTYNPHAIEAKWQKRWADTALYRTPDDGWPADLLLPGLFSLPFGRGAERGPLPQLCAHRRHQPLPPHEGRCRAAPHGLGCLWPARRERGHRQGHPSPRQHPALRSQLPAADDPHRRFLRLGARDQLQPPRLLSLDAVDLSAAVPARPGLPGAGTGQLVRVVPDRAGQRGGRAREPAGAATSRSSRAT